MDTGCGHNATVPPGIVEPTGQNVDCYEPSVAVAADGSVLVAVAAVGAPLYRVRGTAVETLPPVPPASEKTGWLLGNDAILQRAPDGRIFYVDIFTNGGIQVASTPDAGTTWDRNVLPAQFNGGADRPWLAFGTGSVYLTYKASNGVVFSRSDDGGLTWTAPTVADAGKNGGGKPTVLADGAVCYAHPATDGGNPRLVSGCSTDKGATFDAHDIAPLKALSMWPVMAYANGTLIASWRDVGGQYAASSRDEGRTWSAARLLMDNATNGVWLEPEGNRVLAFGFQATGGLVPGWFADAGSGARTALPGFSTRGTWSGTDYPDFAVAGKTAYAVVADGSIPDRTMSWHVWLLSVALT